jgi:hypothetical protein
MTVKVIIVDQGQGVEIYATGRVTGQELIAAHQEIYASTTLKIQKYHLIDKSHCTEYDVTAADIQEISRLDQLAAQTNPHIIMAIIESNSLYFSLSQVWQAYVEGFVQETRTFTDRESAKQWLLKKIKDNKD